MFNSGYRGRRAPDNAGAINPQIKYTQVKYPVPTITGWSIQGSDDTALNPAGGQTVLVNGTGFAAGCAATVNGQTISPVTLVSPTQISFTSIALAGGTYSLVVYNSTGGAAILVPGLTYSAVPTWTTPAGSIGSYTETTAINTAVVATSDSTMTYTLASGSLPSGSTLYANGVISGTAPVDSSSTTYTFGVTATDVELQDTTRTFTMTINVDVVTWVTPSSGATITLDGSAYSQALSATDLAGYAVSYTANTLPTGLTLSAGTISGTPTVEGNTSTLLTATAATTNRSATNTVTWVVQLTDTYFKYVTMLLSANAAVETASFVSDNSLNNAQLTVVGDTRAQNSNPYQPGYYSTYFPANGNYLTGTTSFNPTSQTRAWTVECWFFPINTTYLNFFCIGNGGAYGNGLYLQWGSTANKFKVAQSNGSAEPVAITSTGTYAVGQWYHVAATNDTAGVRRLFINGILDGTQTYTAGALSSGTTFVINGLYDNNGLGGSGGICYVSNTRLIPDQTLYTASFTPSTTPLLPIPGTVLLLNQNNRFINNSPPSGTITLGSTPQISTATPFTTVYQAGTQYYSASLDGSGDYLTVADNAALEPGVADFTLECWFYPVGSNPANGAGLLTKSNSSSYGPYSLGFTAGGSFQALSSTNGSTWGIQLISSVAYSTLQNKWNHAAYVRSGVLFTLYLNGQSVATATSSAALVDNTNSFMVGYINFASTEFPGVISNVRMTKGVAVYTSKFVPSTTALTATTTVTAAQSWSTSFDGTGDYLTLPSNAVFAMGTSSFTIEFWVYTSNVAQTGFILNTNPGTPAASLYVSFSSSTLRLTDEVTVYASTPTLSNNTWYHIAVVRSGTGSNQTVIYTNGVAGTTGTCSQSFTQASPTIGANSFIGFISNLRIVKGQALYTTTFTPATSPLTTTSQGATAANVSLLTCQNNLVQDNSTNLFAVTAAGDAKPTSMNPFVSTNGIGGTSYSGYFNGSSNYLNTPTTLAAGFGTGDYTVEYWIYATSFANGPTVFDARGSTSAVAAFSDNFSTAGAPGIYFNTGQLATSTITASINTWVHVAYVRNSSVTKIYVNGVVGTSVTDTNNYDATTPRALNIGVNNTVSAKYFTGYISNLRITKGQALYTAAFSPATSPLTTTSQSATAANVSLLTCQSTTFIDNSLNAFTITNNGSTTTQAFNPYSGSTSLLTAQDNTFIDNSAIAKTITANGNAQPVAVSPMTPAYYSNYFNGSTDYLTVSSTANAAFGFGTGDFTVEGWFYGTVDNATDFMIDFRGAVATAPAIFVYTSNQLAFYYNGSVRYQPSSLTFTFNTWNHVALVRSSGVTKFYLNGTGAATTYADTNNYPSAACIIGTDAVAGGSSYWTGYISNVRVTKGQALYTSNFTPSTTPLTTTSQGATAANVSLLTCQSLYFIDNSTNVFTITASGSPKIAGLAPFTQPAAYSSTALTTYGSGYFDGTGDFIRGQTITFGTNPFTIEFWYYPTVLPTNAMLFSAAVSAGTGGPQIQTSTSSLSLGTYGVSNTITTSGGLVLNQWQHIAVVRVGTGTNQTTIYINGQAAVTGTVSTNYVVGTMTIGALYDGSAQNTTGYLSDVRVVNGTALYTTAFLPQFTGPLSAVTGTQLLTLQTRGAHNNSDFPDQSGFNNIVTRAGNTTNGAFSPYGNNYSVYFDGSSYLNISSAQGASLFGAIAGSQITIEFWVMTTNIQGITAYTSSIFGQGPAVAQNGRYTVNLQGTSSTSTQTVYFWYTTGTGSAVNVTTTAAITQNTWNHIAITIDATTAASSTIKIFVNGTGQTFTAQNLSSQTADPGNTWMLGAANDSNQAHTGYISNFRFTRGYLVYTANFTPPTAPLITNSNAATKLLTLQSGRLVDNSPNNVTFTLTGTPKVQKFSPFSTVTVPTYYSGYFNGSTDYLTLPAGTGLSLGTSDFTMEAWVYPTARVTNSAYIIAQSSYGVGSDFALWITSTGILQLYLLAGGAGNIASSTGTVPLNAWTHVAAVRSGSSFKLYINGVNDGSLTNSSSITNTYTPTTIGNSTNNTGTVYFPGYISNLRVTKQALYTSAFTPSTSPLTTTSQGATASNVSLLTLQNNTFVDNSPNYYAITAGGSPKLLAYSPPFIPAYYSNNFNGSTDYLSGPATGSASFDLSTGNWTVEAWVYPTSVSNSPAILNLYNSAGSNSGLNFFINSSNQLVQDNGISATTAAGTVPLNTWTHVAAVRNSGATQLYVNGAAVGSTIAQAPNTAQYFYVGRDSSTSVPQYFTGYISNLRVTKGQALYTSAFTPATSPLTTTSQGATAANVSLLTCQSPYFIDNSTNYFAITRNGSPAIAATAPFTQPSYATSSVAYTPATFGGSMYFDGSGDYVYVPSTGSLFTYTGDFTIEFWVFPTAAQVSTYNPTFFTANANGDWATNNAGIRVHYSNAIFGSGGGFTTLTYTSALTQNTWNHVALVRSGSTITMYKNGVANGTATYGPTLGYNGCWPALATSDGAGSGGREFAAGYFSDWRITNGKALYTANFYPGTAPATPTTTIGTTVYSSTLLLPGTASGVTDASRNLDIETIADAKVTPFSPYNGTYYSNYFNNTSYFTLPNVLALGSGDFTIEFWFNSLDVSTSVNIYEGRPSGTEGAYPTIYTTSGALYYYTNSANRITSSTITTGVWYHVAVVRSSGVTKMYLNGTQTGSSYTDSATYLTGANRPAIATYNGSQGTYYGWLADLRVVNSAVYTTTFTPSTVPLTAISGTQLLICQSNKFVDNSSNAYTLTAAGAPQVATKNPFQLNSGISYYFDGTGDYLSAPTNVVTNLSTGNFTIEFWVNPTTWYGSVFEIGGASQYLVIYRNNSSSTTKMGVRFNNNAGSDIFSTADVPVNQWSYWALVRNNGTATWYCNGVAGGSASYATAIPGGTVTLGYSVSFNIIYTGYIADFRLTNGYARYTSNFTPPTAPYKTN